MSTISRRALLLTSGGAVIASAVGAAPQRGDRGPSRDLRALIKTHKATYAAFVTAVQGMHSGDQTHARASRTEEKALLAVCAYPAVGESDRRAKARYLLKIEARGELDLAQHMQTLLHSTMWKD